MSDDFEHMDIPESVRKAVREVEDYFNSRTTGTWEYMGLADRRLVCKLQSEKSSAIEKVKLFRTSLQWIKMTLGNMAEYKTKAGLKVVYREVEAVLNKEKEMHDAKK